MLIIKQLISKLGATKMIVLVIASLALITALLPVIKNIKQNQRSAATAVNVARVFPNIGSTNGGDRLIIEGNGFVEDKQIYFTQISTGSYHTCAISSDKKAYCWGLGNNGQLGNDSTSGQYTPVRVSQGEMPIAGRFIKISSGRSHTCAFSSDNKTYCWGEGINGQLGNGTSGNYNKSLIPARVHQGQLPNSKVGTEISLDGQSLPVYFIDQGRIEVEMPAHVEGKVDLLVKNPDGTQVNLSQVYEYYQLKDSQKTPLITRVGPDGRMKFASSEKITIEGSNLTGGIKWKQIENTSSGGCGLLYDGELYCWGDARSGTVASWPDGAYSSEFVMPDKATKGEMPDGVKLLTISNFSVSGCGLASNNKAYCWGDARGGKLGNDKTYNPRNYTDYFHELVEVKQGQLPAGERYVQISVGSLNVCALATDKEVYCWGYEYGTSPVKMAKGQIQPDERLTQISIGNYFGCGVSNLRQVYCWGYNSYGNIGDGTKGIKRDVPTKVNFDHIASDIKLKAVSAGAAYVCAVSEANKIYCWGYNPFLVLMEASLRSL